MSDAEKARKGAHAMKESGVIWKLVRHVSWAALLVAIATAGASTARAQDKSMPASKVERLNRAPVSKEILHVQLPRPTVVKLKNGLTLVLLEDHKLPTLSFAMQIRPGQLADPKRAWLVLAMILLIGTLAMNFQVVLPVVAKAVFHGTAGTYGFLSATIVNSSVICERRSAS